MERMQKVLFPSDFSMCSQGAAIFAFNFAKQSSARVHLLYGSLLTNRNSGETATASSPPEADLDQKMDELLKINTTGVPVCKVDARGVTATEAILAYAEEHEVDVIVMGTHGRRGFRRWLLGSVAEEVVRHAVCPVITVSDKAANRSKSLSTILAPIDFSPSSLAALKQARILAASLDACLILLHVIPEPRHPEIYRKTQESVEHFFEDAKEKSIKMIHTLLEEEEPEVHVKVVVLSGDPASEILKLSEETDCDLIFLARRGLSQTPMRPIGSVAEHIVRSASCPVLTAHYLDT